MKILFVSSKMPYPLKDGFAIASYNLASALSDLGVDVSFFTMNTSKHYFDFKKVPKEIVDKIKLSAIDVNVDISLKNMAYNYFFSKMPYNYERFVSFNFEKALVQKLEKEKFDIVQVEGLYAAQYIDVIKKFSNAKIVYRAHNIESDIWERNYRNAYNPFKRIYLKSLKKRVNALEKSMINKYDLLMPITEKDLNSFNALGNTKPAIVVQTGFDVKSLEVAPTVKAMSIAYLGSLDWIANQEALKWFLSSCWRLLKKAEPGLLFHIAGRNAPNWLKKEFAKYDGVHFHGEVPNSQEFIKKYPVLIAPLFAGGGMRIKIVESMALGKAIVTTTIGAEGIPATHNQDILIGDTTRDFNKHIVFLLKDIEFAASVAKNARAFAEKNYDNKEICSNALEFYKKAL